MKVKCKKTWLLSFVYMAVYLSVLCQIDTIEKFIRPIMFILWIGICVYILAFQKKIKLSKITLYYSIIYLFVVILCMICSISGTNHLQSGYLKIMKIPFMMCIIGDYLCDKLDDKNIFMIVKVYIISSFIYAVWVHMTYFNSYSNWLKQNSYAFDSKNSASQIWGTAILLILFYVIPLSIQNKQKTKTLIWTIVALYLLVIVTLSQCRTALLSLMIAIISWIFFNSKHRFKFAVLLVILVFILWNTPFIKAFIDKAFFISRYKGADLNTISSGRLIGYIEALKLFWDHPFFGVGKWYIDCSYICILTELGITGFIFIESLWGYIITRNLNHNNKSMLFYRIMFVLTIFYVVTSFLEAYAPFGPGVSSFMFWLLCTILYNRTDKDSIVKCQVIKKI